MNFDFKQTKEQFSDAENYLKQEYLQISTGRANPALLDGIMVNSYGTMQPIKNIASINLEDPRTMKVTPWDKSQLKDIEKAITDSQLPFSLAVDDTGVRVHIPQMTEESKTKILKLVKEKLEDGRIKVRNVRQDTMKVIESNDESSDDSKANFKDELQKLVDASNKSLEEIYDKKENSIMSV
ncbi:MAG: ribosome recycling factor [Crocinitomicaceae bacterium]|jgi:ribosome recycling factor